MESSNIDFDTIDLLMYTAGKFPIKDSWLSNLCKRNESSIGPRLGYYRFLYLLVAAMQPRYALELGVETGLASAHMARAAMRYGGHVIGIDINQYSIPETELSKIYNYTFILGDIIDKFYVVDRIVGNRLGLVFQDSSHHYDASIAEWNTYSPLMKPGSVWVCDDIHKSFHDPKVDPPGKGMLEYFHNLPGKKKLYPYANGGNAIGVVII